MDELYKICIYVVILLECLACIHSIYFAIQNKIKLIWFIPFYLLMALIPELLGLFVIKGRNYYLYFHVQIMEGFFWILLFYNYFKNTIYHYLVILSLMLYSLALIYDIYMLNTDPNQFTFAIAQFVGYALFVVLYLIYLYDLVEAPQFIDVTRKLRFWLSSGFFIYIIMSSLKDAFLEFPSGLSYDQLYKMRFIQFGAGALLYSFFIIGFTRCKEI